MSDKERKTATLVIDNVPGSRMRSSVYGVSPPATYEKGRYPNYVATPCDYVRVSWGVLDCNTCVFPCEEDGKVLDWSEIASVDGFVDDKKALAELGYTIVV